MRLFFINRYYWPDESATSLMLTDLAQALVAAGHEVHVLTSRQQLEHPGANLATKELHQGVHIQRLWTTSFGRQRLLTRAVDYLSFYLAALLRLLWQLRRGDTVIAKTDPPLISVIAAIAARLRGARLINWLQDVYPEIAFRLGALREGSLLGRLLKTLRDGSLRRAAANVVVGERMKQFVEAQVPGCAPVHVIHNWSQPLRATPIPEATNPYRLQLGLRDKIVFGYSGNLGRAHDFAAILEAASLLREREDIHFLIIGGGAQLDTVRKEVAARQLRTFSFLPYQPRARLADSLGAADVHLVSLNPALEGLIVPSKIYGILAAGRPCIFIGAADGEVSVLLGGNQCGLACSDGRSLVAAISHLADSQTLREDLSAKAAVTNATIYAAPEALGRWSQALAQSQTP